MYYDIAIFSQFIVAPTGCIVNAMDLKFFPTLYIVLLKVDHFKGFSNWHNIDELVINSMSRCNYKNYKLNNNNYKLKNSLTLKQCFVILRTF